MKPTSVLFLAFSCAFLFSSCSSFSLQRSLSSTGAAKEEIVLEHLLESDSPQIATRELMARLLKIRLRAQAWVQEFDAALSAQSNDGDIFSMPSYQKLLVARPLAERTESKIIELYGAAREVAKGISVDPLAREREGRAFLVVAGVNEALREVKRSQAKRVLLHDFLVAMKEKFGSEGGEFAGAIAPLQASMLGGTASDQTEEIHDLVRSLPDSDDVKEEVEEEAAKLGAAPEKRNPSANSIFASAGPQGNITGLSFPRGTYALTLDDGPHATFTLAHLSNLQAQGVKATFFWIASYAKNHVPIVKTVQKAGMVVANHSYTHAKITSSRDLRRLDSDVDREIHGSTAELTRIYGFKPKFFRLAYAAGIDDPEIRAMIAEEGMIHVKWNIDSLDWQDRNPKSIVARVEQQMQMNGRGIILMHDVQEATVPALRRLLSRQQGRVRWVTIPEIVDELNRMGR